MTSPNPLLRLSPLTTSLNPQPIIPSNAIVDEVARAHAGLSPEAKQAVDLAHGILSANPPQPQPPAQPQPTPMLPRPGSGPMPTLGMRPQITDQPPQIPAPETPDLPGLIPPNGRVGPRIPYRTLNLPSGQPPTIPTIDEPPQIAGQEPPRLLGGAPGSMSALVPTLNVAPPPHPGYSARVQSLLDEDSARNPPMAETPTPLMPQRPDGWTGAVRGGPEADRELFRLRSHGSGASQIHNPFLRGLATVGDAIGTGLFPRIAAVIPGTTAHHNVLLANAEGATKDEREREAEDDATQNAEATRNHLGAQTDLANAQATEANARAQTLKTPPKEKLSPENLQKTIETDQGIFQWNPDTNRYDISVGKGKSAGKETGTVHELEDGSLIIAHPDGTATAVTLNGKPVKAPPRASPEGEQKLTPGQIAQFNGTSQDRYRVLHHGEALPGEFTLNEGATQKDYDRIEKALGGVESAETAAANRSASQKQGTDKQSAADKREYLKAYQPALDSAERFNVMTKNYDDAIKNHDQQAMLSLLANHLGMTMGLQKGARMTKDIISEAEQSRPWLQGVKAKFDKDGYLTGVNLTPEQMRQMVALGRERFAEDAQKSGSAARYLGSTDDGPERTPNNSTIHHYLDLASGDPAKAKKLASADGWSVK